MPYRVYCVRVPFLPGSFPSEGPPTTPLSRYTRFEKENSIQKIKNQISFRARFKFNKKSSIQPGLEVFSQTIDATKTLTSLTVTLLRQASVNTLKKFETRDGKGQVKRCNYSDIDSANAGSVNQRTNYLTSR